MRALTTRPSPTVLVAAGAALLSLTPTLVAQIDASAGTITMLRCALAALLLAPWVLSECRAAGRPSLGTTAFSLLAGVLLGVDLMLYTESITMVGGGVASLLLSTQVIAFPLLALVLDRQPVSSRFVVTAPVLLAGVALTGGIALPTEHAASSGALGAVFGAAAGITFAGYLYLSRRTERREAGHPRASLLLASVGAGVTAAILAVPTTGLDLDLPLGTWGWLLLLTLTGQVFAWLLIGAGSARLPAHCSATLLTLNPVLAVVLGGLLVGEWLVWSQLVGAVLVLGAMLAAAGIPLRRPPLTGLAGWSDEGRPQLRPRRVLRHLAPR